MIEKFIWIKYFQEFNLFKLEGGLNLKSYLPIDLETAETYFLK